MRDNYDDEFGGDDYGWKFAAIVATCCGVGLLLVIVTTWAARMFA